MSNKGKAGTEVRGLPFYVRAETLRRAERRQRTEYLFAAALALIMMAVIFRFSAADAVKSSGLSTGVSREIVAFLAGMFSENFSAEEALKYAEVIETPVRKCAHFMEYAALGVCVNYYLWNCFKLIKMDMKLLRRIEAAPETDLPGRPKAELAEKPGLPETDLPGRPEAESAAEPGVMADLTGHVPLVCQGITLRAELFCAAYAVSDELHQYFVPGRACRMFDVCVDSAGALFGAAVFWLLLRNFFKDNTD